jgi:transposase
VWAGKDRNKQTLGRFFDDLGADRAAALTHISADGAEWIHDVVTARAPRAVLCLDAFHVVAWASEALEKIRREMTARLRAGVHRDEAAALRRSRWALLKNPPALSSDQRATLAGIAQANGGLYRAYLLKEQLREVFACRDPATARALLTGWIAWARRCRLPAFVRLARTITRYKQLILWRRRPQPVQRPLRSHQRPPTTAHPPRLRLPRPRSTDRHGHPHPRRPLPTTPRTI